MDRQTALLVLQLPDTPTAEETHDAFEKHVFDLRDFLFRQTIIPQVFRAKVNRLLTASEVGETLGTELTPSTITIPDLLTLEGTADQMVRIHADNVGRLRSAMATTLNPSCLSRLGECLVRLQQQYLQHMAEWASQRMLDTAKTVPMREEWSPAAFAAALEAERKGETLDQATASRLATELLRMRTLTRDALPV